MLTIFCAGILGTTIMTGFSHVVELLSGHKFNEAHLLNQLIGLSKTMKDYVDNNYYLGWLIHFLIGISMAAIMYAYYFHFSKDIVIWTGLIFGLALGVIGVAGWSMIISNHSNPPKINWTYFFLQLILAHMIFGITVSWILARFSTYA